MNTLEDQEFSDSSDEKQAAVRLPLPTPKRRKTAAKNLPLMIPGTEPYHKCHERDCKKLSRTYYESCRVFLCLNTNRNCFVKFHN